MWIVAGILLGLVVLGCLVGFHAGPHAHLAAGVVGLVAAVWLVVMVADGRSATVVWVLLGADLVLSLSVGLLGWVTLARARSAPTSGADTYRPVRLEGAEGVALGPLSPEGIVVVRGEHWSARSLNGPVPAGGRVQVLRAEGVRLEVWGEERPAVGGDDRPPIVRAETAETAESGGRGDGVEGEPAGTQWHERRETSR